jgi:septum site-determining protein MinD
MVRPSAARTINVCPETFCPVTNHVTAMTASTAAVVGAAGGVGTTRLTVELGATLARDGRDVALLDAAFATQGLAGYVPGRIDPDLTAVLVDRVDGEAPPLEACVTEVADPDGRLVACPTYAPFERLARAKTPAAAEAFEALLADAARAFDHVLLDTPPVAANQAVAAATAADRRCLVTVAGERGVDALQRATGRLADLGIGADVVVANRTADAPDAEETVPESAAVETDRPACLDAQAPFAPAVADVAEALFDTSLALDFETGVVERTRQLFDGDE